MISNEETRLANQYLPTDVWIDNVGFAKIKGKFQFFIQYKFSGDISRVCELPVGRKVQWFLDNHIPAIEALLKSNHNELNDKLDVVLNKIEKENNSGN